VAAVVLAGCEQLEHVPAKVCGNLVVEAGEECDGFPKEGCHKPETENQCRIDCRKKPCAPGAACAADHVCRMPTGQFDWKRTGEAGVAFTLNMADVTGDHRTDILMGAWESLTTATFDKDRNLTLSGEQQLSYWLLRTGELNGDGREDVIAVGGPDEFTNSLRVLRAGQGGRLTALSSPTPAPAGKARRLFTADSDGTGDVSPLLLVDATLYRVADRAFADPREYLLAHLTETAAKLAGQPAAADFDAGTRCDEVAVAEQGATLVRVYTLCAAAPKKALVSTITLPGAEAVSGAGLFAGEFNGDTQPDLLIVTDQDSLLVSYGLGDGTFHSQPDVGAVTLGDQSAAPLSENLWGDLLQAVADLDQDGISDLIAYGQILLSSKEWRCDYEDLSCWRDTLLGWAGVATGDFTRDGIPDIFAAPYARRSLSFFMGVGGGKFNEFSIPTSGLTAPDLEESTALLTVGDYDGDLVSDLAFAESAALGAQETLTVLFGRAHGIPSEQLRVETFDDIQALSGCQLFRHLDQLSDLTMLGSCANTQCIGRFSGQTNRQLFSPLGVPVRADTSNQLDLVDAAMGRLRKKTGDAAKRDDITMLAVARGQDEEIADRWVLFYVPSTDAGLDSGHMDERPNELRDMPEGATPLLTMLDLDDDGIDEALVHPQLMENGRLTYWLARRTAASFNVTPIGVEALGAPKVLLQSPYNSDRMPRDIDGDGREDLAVGLLEYVLSEEDHDADTEVHYEMIFLANERGTLSPGTTFDLGLAGDVAYLNMDDDRQLEMAVLYEFDLRLYDIDLTTGELSLLRSYKFDEDEVASLEAGDFDGNGVEDLAVVGTALNIFWGEARNP
jgi:hypothetical protein